MSVETIPHVTPKEVHEQAERGRPVDLIDVRTPVEFRELHAKIACLHPLDQLDPKAVMASRNDSKDAPLYVICRTGSRAKKACEKFHAEGFTNAVCVEGGTLAWEAEGLPVVRGKKTISLERQVRIAAGSLVLVGSILGAFVHPGFIAIAAFVGAGLVFAGVTDTCGMGMMLARMPWNQVGSDGKGEGATCTR